MDVINDALKAEYLLNEDYDNAVKVNSKLRRGYFTTNERLGYLKKMEIDNKKVLTICGSGDHAFMSIINGAIEVDTFDNNPLQYYVMELKRAAIMGLEKEEYLKYFPLFGGSINEMYNGKYYEKFKCYLSDEARIFWDYIYKKGNYKLYLLEMFSYPIAYESNYTLDYDLLKERLFKYKITFRLNDVCHVSKSLNRETYKLIILSNVYDHIYRDKEYNEEEFLGIVNKNFYPLLETGGTCIYHYQLPYMPVKSFKNYPSMKCGSDEISYLIKK